MTGIKELLSDVAAEARPYDVTDRALRIARRQRRLAWAAPIAAVVLAAAGAVAVLPPRQGAPVEVGWLPSALDPAEPAPALPDDAVGPAGLAYERGDGSMTVVTDDGRGYNPGAAVLSISRDGRWIALRRGDRLVLRDLNGADTLDVGLDGDTRIAAWSPNGRWVAVRTGADDPAARRGIKVFDLETGRLVATKADDNVGPTTVCGLRDSAYLLLCASVDSSHVNVRKLNPLTGADLGEETLAIPSDLANRRHFAGGQLMPDGHTLVLWTVDSRPNEVGSAAGDPMTHDLDRPGSGLRTYALPVRAEDGSMREVRSSVDEGVLVTRWAPANPGFLIAGVELFDLTTGRLSPITTVTGIRDVVVRGQI